MYPSDFPPTCNCNIEIHRPECKAACIAIQDTVDEDLEANKVEETLYAKLLKNEALAKSAMNLTAEVAKTDLKKKYAMCDGCLAGKVLVTVEKSK